MRRTKLLLLAIVTFIFSCSEKETDTGYTITGIIDEAGTGFFFNYQNTSFSGYIFLHYENFKDSAKVIDNKFVFKGKLDQPTQAWMNPKPPAYDSHYIFLENSNITIKGKYYPLEGEDGSIYNHLEVDTIMGSKSEDLMYGFNRFRKQNRKKDDYITMYMDSMKSMMRNNPTSPTLGRLLSDDAIRSKKIFNYKQLLELYEMLDTTYQSKSDLGVIEKGLAALKMNAIGDKLPAFELPDINDIPTNSSIFNGKKTLVDWWASWCKPCRKKHPKLKEFYAKYKDKGFQIVSISIDKDKDDWLKASQKDGLPWKNLLDKESILKKELGISAIPFNYLLNEQGEIILVNGTLEAIENKLQDTK